jgi:4-aminobutyrate aminotransferase-like enzyme
MSSWPVRSARGNRREQDPNFQPQFVRGSGCNLWDHHGKEYLDFVCGYSSTLFGHGHPRLTRVASEQLNVLTQLVGLRHPWRDQLENELGQRAEKYLGFATKVWLTTTGSRAAELAWKISAAQTPSNVTTKFAGSHNSLATPQELGRVIASKHAYHGRSLATAQLSDTHRQTFIEANVFSPFEYPTKLLKNLDDLDDSEISKLDLDIFGHQADGESICAALFLEPALGARGYYAPPKAYFEKILRTLTTDGGRLRKAFDPSHRPLIVDDEIQMGLGRCGSFLAAERQGWKTDLVLLGKSLGGGIVPIAAVIGSADHMDQLPPGHESETFAANPLACRIALEALAVIDDEELYQRSRQIEAWFDRELIQLQQRSRMALRVGTVGAAAVLEMNPAEAGKVALLTMQQGLLVHWSGLERNRIVLIPPLIASDSELEKSFVILDSILANSVL